MHDATTTAHASADAALATLPLPGGWRVTAAGDADAGGLVRLVGGCFAEYPEESIAAWHQRLGLEC